MLSRIVSTIDTIWTVSLSTIFYSSTTFIWYTHNTVQISTWQEHKLKWLKLLYIWMNSKLNNFGDLFLYYKSLPVFQHGNGVPRFLIQSCYLLYPTSTSQFHHYRSQELDRNLPETLQCFPRHPKGKQKDKINYIPAFVGLILTCRRWTCIKEYSYISSIADYDQQHKRHFNRDNNFLFVENRNSRMTKFYNFLAYIIVWKWFDIHCNIRLI